MISLKVSFDFNQVSGRIEAITYLYRGEIPFMMEGDVLNVTIDVNLEPEDIVGKIEKIASFSEEVKTSCSNIDEGICIFERIVTALKKIKEKTNGSKPS